MIDLQRYRPLYSADNEDTRSELTALDIGADDTVISISAGGGRALSLLTASPTRLIAIDRQPDQIYNLELKAAAIENLSYEAFSAFMGLTDDADRLDQYHILRAALSPSARKYWDNRRRLIRSGVFYAGRTETAVVRFMQRLKAMRLMKWAEPFFQATTVEAQRALLQTHETQVERRLLWWRFLCHPLVIYAVAQDPGFFRSTEGSVGGYLIRRVVQYASVNLVCESFLLRLLFDGRLTPAGPLPIYLTRTGFDQVRKNLDRMDIHCSELRDFIGWSRVNGRLKWSLSDVSGWMTERGFHDLLRGIAQRATPGDRFCARNFAARREIPADLRPRVRRLDGLCAELDLNDSSVVYRFEVGECSPCGPRREHGEDSS
jgi:S-adenosylmethionine-diacylglycerol 3-amino-3-carboxypropyl transferase